VEPDHPGAVGGVFKMAENRVTQCARQHDTSLTRLVTSHLERLGVDDEAAGHAPVTRRLSGAIPADASLQDYRDHLEHKHA